MEVFTTKETIKFTNNSFCARMLLNKLKKWILGLYGKSRS